MFKSLFRKKSSAIVSSDEEDIHGHGLHKVLSVRDLTFFGIAAIIGAGIFSSIGSACYAGGPAVILLFIICAVACGFTAMCYAEFAARVPMSGSAYTYAYVSFGEIFAWIIGWALLMEYSIGNIYVAFSWSGYFTNLLEAVHIHLPAWLTSNYSESHQAFLSGSTGEEYNAWINAPQLGGLRIIFDLPAVAINIIITWLVLVGVKESRNASNIMVIVKLAIIALVIIVGVFYVDIDNWTPFMPNGFAPNEVNGETVGVMAAIAAVFFAFIGFDAVSTLAEECKNPQRDLPRGMIYSLVISTVVFIILALVLTGMTSYKNLNVSDPLADIFGERGVKWMLYIVSISAVVAMTSVILVFQMGQPRIWMTMSRDGLMPKKFSEIHPKYKTPAFSTIMTGVVVGVPIFFTDRTFILDFTSIGTLFAFALVCGGVLVLPPRKEKTNDGKFRLPYVNAQYIVPAIILFAGAIILLVNPALITDTFSINADNAVKNIPMLVFYLSCIFLAIMSYLKKYSLIPVLGLLSCIYLFTGFSIANWKYFGIWLIIGLVVYFLYGYRKSKLNTAQ